MPQVLPHNTSQPPEPTLSLTNPASRRHLHRYITLPPRPERRDIDPVTAGWVLQRWLPPVAPGTALASPRHQPALILDPALKPQDQALDGGVSFGGGGQVGGGQRSIDAL